MNPKAPISYYIILGLVSMLFLFSLAGLGFYLAGMGEPRAPLTLLDHAWGGLTVMAEAAFLYLLLRRKKAAFIASIFMAVFLVLPPIYRQAFASPQGALNASGLVSMATVVLLVGLIPLEVGRFRRMQLLR